MDDVRRTSLMTPTSRTRRPLLAVAALSAALALSACNGDDDPGNGSDGTSDPSSPTDSTEPTEPTEPTESSEPPEPETPLGTGAAPATGQLVEFDALSLRVPKGWEVFDLDDDGLIAQAPGDLSLDFLEIDCPPNSGLTSPVDKTRRERIREDELPPAFVQPDIEVDGVPTYHLSGRVARSTWVESFGSNSTAYEVDLTFDLDPSRSTAEQRALADSVLATIDMVE